MSATWILRRIDTGKVIWTGVGADNPDVVVDPSVYRSIFAQSFPHVALTWGAGEFEVVYSGDATYKVGPVSAYTITRTSGTETLIETSEDENILVENLKVAATELGAPARIVGDFDAEVHARLGQGGLPLGIRVEDGIPQPVVKEFIPPATPLEWTPSELEAGVRKRAADAPLPLEEAADFIMLLKNVKKTILPRSSDWAARISRIPSYVIDHFAEHDEGMNLDADTVIQGRMFIGMNDDGQRYQLQTDTFLVDDCSPKTRLYIRWAVNYQQVEAQVLHNKAVDAEECFKLCLEMFHDATELYLREKGWTPQPGEVVKATDIYDKVMVEMRARAKFVADKDAEYGQPIRRHGIYGVVVRVFDKIARFTNLKAGGVDVPLFESALDSLKDLGGYSLILAGMFQEQMDIEMPKTEKA